MLRAALRLAIGIALAAVIWIWISPSYVALIAPAAGHLVQVDPRLRHLDVKVEEDGKLILRGGSEAPDLPLGWLDPAQLTYNTILFAGLLAATRGILRGRAGAVVLASLALVATHILATATAIEQLYANAGGAWSTAHYGGTEQDFWKSVLYAYQLAGMFAIAFVLWWLSAPSEARTGRARPAG